MHRKLKIIKITKSGYIYIFITIFIGFAAINTGNNLLYLLTSSLLGFMGISGFFGKRNIENLQISLTFPEDIFANVPFYVKIKVKNNKKFIPSFLIKLKIKDSIISIPFINKDELQYTSTVLKFKNRGFEILDEVHVFSPFPFNFFIRSKSYRINYKILIYPEPKKIDFLNYNAEDNNRGINEISKQGTSGDLIKIREYNESDSIKFIHWKLSGKYKTLMTKVLSSEEDKSVIIEFDKVEIHNIELKLSAITYFVIKNSNVILKINNKTLKNKRDILKELALYGLKE